MKSDEAEKKNLEMELSDWIFLQKPEVIPTQTSDRKMKSERLNRYLSDTAILESKHGETVHARIEAARTEIDTQIDQTQDS